MHWGHAVSTDLLHWEYLPTALAPDELYDKDGCFSGSAITLPDGRHLLMYTGVYQERTRSGGISDVQIQCLAVGDGIDYKKYEKNPVLDERNLPEGSSRNDFRDPKIFRKADGTYGCVIGNRPADGSGQILMYTSPDGFSWKYDKILAINNNRFGKMWECPDFFEMDGKQILFVSPQDMLPEGFEYHNGNGTLCIVGEYDEKKEKFVEEHIQSIDYGIDFYAPQTIETPDGRRVVIGWMQNWDTCNCHDKYQKWFGQMSLPRELSLVDGRLYQKPLKELENMRKNKVSYESLTFSGLCILEGMKGRKVDIEMTVRAVEGEDIYQKFIIRFAQNEKYYSELSFRPRESVLKIDRKFSGSRRASVHQRRCRVDGDSKELKLRIILDRFSAEVFINDGRQTMTATIYTEQCAEDISFFADGKVNMDIVKYDLQ